MGQGGIKVLYISGWTRIGSTILDRILGHVEGYFSLGEFRYVWDRGILENRLCGNGLHFHEDPLWVEIFDRAFGGIHEELGREMTDLRDRLIPKRALGWMMLPGNSIHPKGLETFRSNLVKLYTAIQEVTGAEVIVDSTKSPPYGYILSGLPGFDVRTVHLTRDPRAVCRSWLRTKQLNDGAKQKNMKILHPADNAFHWDYWNMATEMLVKKHGRPSKFLRYEDLMREPKKRVESLLEFMDTPNAKTPFVSDHTVNLGPDHTVAGNPDRMKHGEIELKTDDQWRDDLPAGARRWTEAMCGVMMKRYGYTR